MIIQANTLQGQKTKVYNQDGTEITLPIKSYNTETQEAEVYELDENGRVKTTEWVMTDKSGRRQLLINTVKLEGSYAEIDGKRV